MAAAIRLSQQHSCSFASCSLGSPSRFCRSCLGRLFYLLYSLHHPLPELLGLVREHLSLPTNKVALDLGEFLGLFDTNDFVSRAAVFHAVWLLDRIWPLSFRLPHPRKT